MGDAALLSDLLIEVSTMQWLDFRTMHPYEHFDSVDMVLQYVPHRLIKKMHENAFVLPAGEHLMQHLLGGGGYVDIFKLVIREGLVGAQSKDITSHRKCLICAHASMDKPIAV